MKRSKLLRPVTLGLIGFGAFALTACTEDPPEDVNIFTSAQECLALPGATAESCESGYKEAMAQHEQTAPRYDTLEYCEEQHGVGNCGTEAQPQTGGGGSIFMPLLMGYMMGRMLGGGGGFGSKPLYPTPGGGMATADKSASFGAGAKGGKVSAGALAPAKPTAGTAPMSKATAASRGGFGSSGGGSTGSAGG